jgi:hypothetical protein
MDPQDAINRCCPRCESSSGVVHAASVTREDAPVWHLLDVRIPGRALWSGLWVCSVGCFVLGLVAWLIDATTGWLGAAGVFAVFGVTFAALGFWHTRVNHRLMRGAEPLVRKLHAHALFCRACECVYFDLPRPPAGITPGKAIAAREYRRRLWYACGFTKPI